MRTTNGEARATLRGVRGTEAAASVILSETKDLAWCKSEYVYQMVLPTGRCVASTGSATVYENYFYALLFYFLNAKVFIIELLF